MLKQRMITAIVLAPVVIACVFLLPIEGFATFFALVSIIGAWEWASLSDLKKTSYRLLYAAVVLAALCGGWWIFQHQYALFLILPALLLWCAAFLWIKQYPKQGLWAQQGARMLLGLLFLTAAWLSLLGLKALPAGNAWLLLILLVVWAADIGAYFSGKRWGKNKLAPNVSPGKTREGMYGGLAAITITAIVFSLWNELAWSTAVYVVLLSVVVGVVSVMGDLFESLLKRHAGMKDSGTILPGHGGVLDRIDSILSAAPFYYVGLCFLPIV